MARLLLIILQLLAIIPLICKASSAQAGKSEDILGLKGLKPDPFVAASPLIVAAVCRDGIAMVAAHTASTKEKLLSDFRDKIDSTQQKGFAGIWNDLPADHGGPYRINRIDRCGTYLMAAGWRGDCDFLLEKIRSIASQEIEVFGKPQWGLPYGRLLAKDASLWMAHMAVSEQLRPLSCVGLLCTCWGGEGSLWFVDVTGAYQVKTLAIGGGKADGDDLVVAQLVNSKLIDTDFRQMTAQEGVACIMRILAGENDGGEEKRQQLVPSGSEIEAAIVDHSKHSAIQRLKLSNLN